MEQESISSADFSHGLQMGLETYRKSMNRSSRECATLAFFVNTAIGGDVLLAGTSVLNSDINRTTLLCR